MWCHSLSAERCYLRCSQASELLLLITLLQIGFPKVPRESSPERSDAREHHEMSHVSPVLKGRMHASIMREPRTQCDSILASGACSLTESIFLLFSALRAQLAFRRLVCRICAESNERVDRPRKNESGDLGIPGQVFTPLLEFVHGLAGFCGWRLLEQQPLSKNTHCNA